MVRFAARLALATTLVSFAVPVAAEERSRNVAAPSQAVADAWAKEARERERAQATRPSSRTVNVLAGSYGVLQGLDMYSTVVARNRGAREVNPLMNTGYAQAAIFKAAMTTTTLLAVKRLEKKNKTAAIATMVAMNVVSAVVVTTNFKNAQRLK
jgi:hypothetical protein